MNKLFLFTASFPYGIGENWIVEEIKLLSFHYNITIVPFTYGGSRTNGWDLPPGVKVQQALFEKSENISRISPFIVLNALKGNPVSYLKEAFVKKIYSSKKRLGQFFYHVKLEQSLLSNAGIKNIITETGPGDVWYFYWGLGASQLLTGMNRTKGQKIIVRMHGYDLYDFRNYGYIPFRKKLMQISDLILPVSDNGRAYLATHYPFASDKIVTARLGTYSKGISRMSEGNCLHLISCSALIPLKRVKLIAEALCLIRNFKVKWTHFGDGPQKDNILRIIDKLPENCTADLKGYVPPEEIPKLYAESLADLFIHVSETEGVPVAIMEALAAGIPVYATNVGGVAEIVDHNVGKLLNANISPDQIAQELTQFFNMDHHKKSVLRAAAIQRFEVKCNAVANAKDLTSLIKNVN